MKRKILGPLSFALCFLAVQVASSEQPSPPTSITQAKWEDYRNDYQNSPLCAAEEVTLWTCETGTRVYSLCSSRIVNRTFGYVQYRASKSGKVVLLFPAQKQPPSGSFAYHSHFNGDASLDFSIKGYRYSLADPLRDHSVILVWNSDSAARPKEIACDNSNQTLQLNYTMRLMLDSGVWEGR